MSLPDEKEPGFFSAIKLLGRKDQRKLILLVSTQVSLNFLDLVGIGLIGIVGSLAVNGISAKSPGDRTTQILKFMHLEEETFHFQIVAISVAAIFILILKTALSIYLSRRVAMFLSYKAAKLTSELSARMLNQPFEHIKSLSIQDTLYALTTGVQSIILGIVATTSSLIADVSLLIVISIGLLIIDIQMAISSFVFFGGLGLILYLAINKRARRIGKLSADLNIASSRALFEALTIYRELIISNSRTRYINRIQQQRNELAQVMGEMSFIPSISKYIFETVVVLSVMMISALQFLSSDSSHAVAVISIFLAASSRFAPAVLRIQQSTIVLRNSAGSASPTLALISTLDKITNDHGPKIKEFESTEKFIPSVRISDLEFRYLNHKTLNLSGINLNIEPGSFVAIVGPSGSGKTTLADVMLGLLTPTGGTVLVSGVEPSQALKLWPGAIAYVPQEVLLLQGTIAENISLGLTSTLEIKERILAAVDLAQLTDYVATLPKGLDTEISGRGNTMSGGQKQRLGFARALFSNPSFILLDEATSALDGSTEDALTRTIGRLNGKVTVVMIAHRLSTVRNADKVVYLEKGKVRAVGTFEEVKKAVPDFMAQAKLMGL